MNKLIPPKQFKGKTNNQLVEFISENQLGVVLSLFKERYKKFTAPMLNPVELNDLKK